MRSVPAALLAALLVSCSGAGEGGGGAAQTGLVAPAAAATPRAPSAGRGREVTDENPAFSFAYSYPAAAAAIPPLRARLEADLSAAKARLAKDAAAARAEAGRGGHPYQAWYWSQKWSVVSDLPRWLSLSAEYGSYTGGAHGMYWFGAMLWDKAARMPRDPLTLFTSKQALSSAIRTPFCAALDRQRAQKRKGEPGPGGRGEFDSCIDPVKQTVILGSRGRKRFDRIGILVAPYEAGPYAEGSYEVTVPVTAAVLGAVKPQYRASFASGR